MNICATNESSRKNEQLLTGCNSQRQRVRDSAESLMTLFQIRFTLFLIVGTLIIGRDCKTANIHARGIKVFALDVAHNHMVITKIETLDLNPFGARDTIVFVL